MAYQTAALRGSLLRAAFSLILNILATGLPCRVLIGCCRRKFPATARLIIAPWNCLYLQISDGIRILDTLFHVVYMFRIAVKAHVTMNSEHTKRSVQSDDDDDEERTKKSRLELEESETDEEDEEDDWDDAFFIPDVYSKYF